MNDAIPLSRRVPLSAIAALLRLTVERQIRGTRALVFLVLHLIPVAIAAMARYQSDGFEAERLEILLVFGLIPQALVPLTALLFASGMANDAVEERTITYVFIRPIPKWLIYLSKVAATVAVTCLLASVSMLATLAAIHWGDPALAGTILPRRGMALCATSLLSLWVYVPLFGLVGLLVRRSLVAGVVYIAVLEGLIANVDFVVRRGTVMYWSRIVWIRLLGVSGDPWSIDDATIPAASTAVVSLVVAGCVLTAIGAAVFSQKEFRVKTSEAS